MCKILSCLTLVTMIILQCIPLETLELGDRCRPNKQFSSGECKEITDCEIALRDLYKRQYNFLRCGFNDDMEIVCCPKESSTSTGEKPTITSTRFNGQRVAERECNKLAGTVAPPLSLHIIGGEEASLGEFPHMVALGVETRRGEYSFTCGGTLISSNFVLTAGHCVKTIDMTTPNIIRGGVTFVRELNFNPKTDVRISQIILHPNYTRSRKYHDLALLKLESPVEFSSDFNPACLYTKSEDPRSKLTITGWGQYRIETTRISDTLLKANVSLVSRETCRASYETDPPNLRLPQGLIASQLCAGEPDARVDTCQGDSGGPLQVLDVDGRYRIVGVTSFGLACATRTPGVYTRVADYLDWIEQTVWPNSN